MFVIDFIWLRICLQSCLWKPEEGEHQFFWMASYRWLKTLLCVLGTEPEFTEIVVIPFAAEFAQTKS